MIAVKQKQFFNGFVIVPAKLIATVQQPEKGHWKEKFSLLANFIRDNLPNALSLDSELDLWETNWISYKGSVPDNVSNTLKSIKFSGFQNIKVALRIIGTLPVTSCECERSFSALRRLKTYTRSTMVAERLNGLALLHVHKDIIVNIDKVIDLCAMKNPLFSTSIPFPYFPFYIISFCFTFLLVIQSFSLYL